MLLVSCFRLLYQNYFYLHKKVFVFQYIFFFTILIPVLQSSERNNEMLISAVLL